MRLELCSDQRRSHVSTIMASGRAAPLRAFDTAGVEVRECSGRAQGIGHCSFSSTTVRCFPIGSRFSHGYFCNGSVDENLVPASDRG